MTRIIVSLGILLLLRCLPTGLTAADATTLNVEEPVQANALMKAAAERAAAFNSSGGAGATLRSDQTGTIASRVGDVDGDGLTDTEEGAILTDSLNPDTDGDGLLDGWEVKGVNNIDLKALGADPRHKDIFIEMDFMDRATATNGLGPSPDVMRRIVAAYADAPVTNPDGRIGVTVHLELDDKVPYDEDLNPYTTEFAALKRAHFVADRAPVYHYMIWGDAHENSSSSGHSMDIPSSDFIVTLGRWNGRRGGDDDEKVGTFVHELGHNLGLKHGGVIDDVNYKPNHLSVMNYRWQTRGVIVDGVAGHYTYQPFDLPRLVEFALDESKGLSGTNVLQRYTTQFNGTDARQHDVPAAGAINWNRKGSSTDNGLELDINGDGLVAILERTPNEWANRHFMGGTIGSTAPLRSLAFTEQTYRVLPLELTEELNDVLTNQQ